MPVAYRFSNNIVVLELSGKYSIGEMKTAITSSLDNPDCPENAVMLLDLRQDESVHDRSPRDIREMSYFFGDIRNRINCRMCMVTSDNLSLGLMNMAKAYDQGVGIESRAFTDFEKALAWLDSPGKDRTD